jgi:pimeloyl-ACP methyl ester carboxylesterase
MKEQAIAAKTEMLIRKPIADGIAAPFIGEGGWPSDDVIARKHLGAALPDGVPVYRYHGSDDETAPLAHVDSYAEAIPDAVVRRLRWRDHQLNNDLSEVAATLSACAAVIPAKGGFMRLKAVIDIKSAR